MIIIITLIFNQFDPSEKGPRIQIKIAAVEIESYNIKTWTYSKIQTSPSTWAAQDHHFKKKQKNKCKCSESPLWSETLERVFLGK